MHEHHPHVLIESLYQHRILAKQYITQAVDTEISVTVIMKEKKSGLCFCSPFLLHNVCYYYRNQHMKKDKGKLLRGDSLLPFL